MLGLAITLAFVLLLVIAGVAAYAAAIYNSLVQVKNNVDQAWSNIDVLLKQRTDELGKLIDAVKGYLGYERDLLTRLTTLRSQVARGGPDESRLAAEREIGAGMGRVFALAENYPELKSSGNFLELQKRISGLEEQIAHRREFYNDAVNINNVRIEQVPDRLLAAAAGLRHRPLFEATAEERADVDVGARLKGIVASLLVIGSFTLSTPAAGQARTGAAGSSGKGACSLLTREVIDKALGGSVNPMLLKLPPTEEAIGKSGSSCAYGGVTLQIDFLTPQEFEDMRKKVGKDWMAVSGIGDAAYFRNNQNLFGEVLGRTGSRTFSVLIGLKANPIDKVKTNVTALANAIVPKMQ